MPLSHATRVGVLTRGLLAVLVLANAAALAQTNVEVMGGIQFNFSTLVLVPEPGTALLLGLGLLVLMAANRRQNV